MPPTVAPPETAPAAAAPRRRSASAAFAAGIAATALAAALLWATAADRDRLAFEAAARDVEVAVLKHVETSVALLRGAAGLFAAAGTAVDSAAFHRYVSRLALREHYPGILGIGFSRRMTAAERAAVEGAMRAQGHPQFRVWPEDERPELHAILHLEPLDARNRAAIGYDMYTSPVRAQAMAQARDSGYAAASGTVELVQEIDELKQPGFLIYLPVYRGGATPPGLQARREQLFGFAYSPVRAGDFLSSAFRETPAVGLAVFHGTGSAPQNLLYRTAAPAHAPRFRKTETIDVVGQPWTFVFESHSALHEALVLPLLIFLGGAALSALLALLVRRQGDAQWEAQRALERERAARSEAERANVMKDEFLATVSHELRTPLGAIVGWAEVLRTGRLPADQVAAAIDVVYRNARAQARLIDDLLDMNRILTGKMRLEMQALDVARAVDEAIASMRPAAEAKGIRLETRIDSPGLVVRGDASRLQQIVWNLLSNAVKFTPVDGCVQVVLERAGAGARLSVSDTGVGIEPRFLERIFGRFEQIDAGRTRRHGGLGIGLAVVRQLVELHGGTVTARSDGIGKGATFVVVLPLMVVAAPAQADAPAATGSREAALTGTRVLVVDDDADSQALMRRVLEDRGAQVHCASDAQSGLEALSRLQPDVLLSDIGMPQMDGYEFMRRVRALPPEAGGKVPAAAITAYARDEDRLDALRSGFQVHLVKPVSTDELLAVVCSLVGRPYRTGTDAD